MPDNQGASGATRRVLLTGFEPFDGASINPSWEIAKALDGQVIAGALIVARRLPCVFGQSLVELRRALTEVDPMLVLAIGLAGGRSELSMERIAINVDDARIPDNAGAVPIDLPVVRGAPAAYFSTWPIKSTVARLRDEGIPAGVSQSAGTFVCNHVFFGLMHALAGRAVKAGFMHVPCLPEQAAGQPPASSLDLETMIRATRIALRVGLQDGPDLALGAGALH